MDAIKFLIRQHRRIEALFSRYEKSPRQRREIFALMERAIIPHAVLEEMYVYPLIRERVPGGDTLAERALHEHAEVEATLKQIGSMHEDSDEFDSAMRRVIDAVSHHVFEEEAQPGLLGMLKGMLTNAELNQLGRTLKAAEDMTPTRAHPLAPDRPPLNKLVGLPTAVVDRLRDQISGRSELSERRLRTGKRRSSATTRKRRSARSATRTRGAAAARSGAAKRGGATRRRSTAKRQAARRPARARTKARRR